MKSKSDGNFSQKSTRWHYACHGLKCIASKIRQHSFFKNFWKLATLMLGLKKFSSQNKFVYWLCLFPSAGFTKRLCHPSADHWINSRRGAWTQTTNFYNLWPKPMQPEGTEHGLKCIETKIWQHIYYENFWKLATFMIGWKKILSQN